MKQNGYYQSTRYKVKHKKTWASKSKRDKDTKLEPTNISTVDFQGESVQPEFKTDPQLHPKPLIEPREIFIERERSVFTQVTDIPQNDSLKTNSKRPFHPDIKKGIGQSFIGVAVLLASIYVFYYSTFFGSLLLALAGLLLIIGLVNLFTGVSFVLYNPEPYKGLVIGMIMLILFSMLTIIMGFLIALSLAW
ncbi:hypothetical protein GYB22_03350 [bacterium]|nr:hypothetical protein [bacterium]